MGHAFNSYVMVFDIPSHFHVPHLHRKTLVRSMYPIFVHPTQISYTRLFPAVRCRSRDRTPHVTLNSLARAVDSAGLVPRLPLRRKSSRLSDPSGSASRCALHLCAVTISRVCARNASPARLSPPHPDSSSTLPYIKCFMGCSLRTHRASW